jgi:hypothetical protein
MVYDASLHYIPVNCDSCVIVNLLKPTGYVIHQQV